MKRTIVVLVLTLILNLLVCVPTNAAQNTTTDFEYVVELAMVDGVKDEVYLESNMIDSTRWKAYSNSNALISNPNVIENKLYYAWDDEYIYLFFECNSNEMLYCPSEDETRKTTDNWHESINVFLDTAPSLLHSAKCIIGSSETERCNHISCNANDSSYRLQASVDPAFENDWWNYYRSDEGMFLTYEQFCSKRCDPYAPSYESSCANDPKGAYINRNGNCEAVSFVDYEKNTYGFEMKYNKGINEEYFLINISNSTPEYMLSFCNEVDLTIDSMLKVYYQNSAQDVFDLIENLPDDISLANKDMITQIRERYDALSQEHKNLVENYSVLLKAEEQIETLTIHEVISAIDKLPTDWSLYSVDSEAYIEAANTLYDQLTPSQRSKVTNANILTTAFKLVDKAKMISLGNINGDATINASDALMALKYAVNKQVFNGVELTAADINTDGTVNAKDALTMLKIAVGKDDIKNYIPEIDDPNKISLYLPIGGQCNKDAFDMVAQFIQRNGSYNSKYGSYTYKNDTFSATIHDDARISLSFDGVSLGSGSNFGHDLISHSIMIKRDQQETWYQALRSYMSMGSTADKSYNFIYSLPEKSWTGNYSDSLGKDGTIYHAVNIWEDTADWFEGVLYRNGVTVSLEDLGVGFENQKVNPDDIVLEKK